MTREEKQLLLKDLCARLPYGVIIAEFDKYDNQIKKFKLQAIGDSGYLRYDAYRNGEQGAALYSEVTHNYCKPYLRPMSSMTEKETNEYNEQIDKDTVQIGKVFETANACMVGLNALDWLNAHHFDYRGLIEKGLALTAPEGMYNIK